LSDIRALFGRSTMNAPTAENSFRWCT